MIGRFKDSDPLIRPLDHGLNDSDPLVGSRADARSGASRAGH